MIILEILLELALVFFVWLFIFAAWYKLGEFIEDYDIQGMIMSLVCSIVIVITVLNHIDLVNAHEEQIIELQEANEYIELLEEELGVIDSKLTIGDTAMVFSIPEIIEENIVYQDINYEFDIMTPSNLTADDIYKMLSEYPTPIANNQLIQYSEIFYEVEQEYGVNSLYLVATLALESGWGNHTSGVNNIGGWTRNDGGFMDFNSVEDCIHHIGNRLSTSYVEAVGSNIGDVMYRYCQTPGYGDTVLGIMVNLQEAL